MRIRGRWVACGLLVLALLGVAGYFVGWHGWARHHYAKAQQALERRAFAEATVHLEKTLEVWSSDVDLRLLLAQVARRSGQFSAAHRHLRAHETELGPALPRVLEYRLLRVQQGDLTEVPELLASCSADPMAADTPLILEAIIEGSINALIPAFLQRMTFAGGPAERSLIFARRAVDLWLELRTGHADHVQGLVWRGNLQVLANHPTEALADLRQALALDPAHFEARLDLAMLVRQWSPTEAAPHLELLRQQNPKHAEVRMQLAEVHRSLGRFDEARQLLEEALAEHPDNAKLLADLGQLALEMQRPAEAERLLRQALERAPRDPRILLALASCLRGAGRAAEAQPLEDRYREIERAERKKWLEWVDK
jgi:tetratricopeptide (TPR) repeat protein